jgi:hypothetical protein
MKIPAQEDGLDRLAELCERAIDRMLYVGAIEAAILFQESMSDLTDRFREVRVTLGVEAVRPKQVFECTSRWTTSCVRL